MHIKQKTDGIYTIVITEGFIGNINTHPSVVDHPELFEVVDADPPEDCQYLIYSP